MEMSLRGKIELACLEGLATQPYLDSVGVVTIGIGATVSEIADLPKWPKTKSLTIPEVIELFGKSLKKYETAVKSVLKAEVTQQEFDSLVSLCYNIGCGGIKKSTLIKRINAGESFANIRQAFLMWNKPKEIIGRRTKEALLFTTGEYQTNGVAQLFETGGTGKIQWSKTKNINLLDYFT